MNRRDRLLWLLLGSIALAVRLGYAVEFAVQAPGQFMTPSQYEDGWLYCRQAELLAAGHGFGNGVLHEGPAYGTFLALVRLAGMRTLPAVYVLQALLGSIACVLTGLAGARLYGQRAGLLAGLLAALYAPLVFHAVLPMAEALAVPLYALLLWTLAGAADGRRALLAGITCGLLTLLRGTNVLLVPLLLPGVWRAGRRQAALFLAAACCVTGLLTARNVLLSDEPVLLTANGGIAFWMGNTPGAPGWYADPVPTPRAAALPAPELSYAQRSRELLRGTLAAIAAAPGRWLQLLGRKAWLALHPYEVSTQGDYPARRAAGNLLGSLPDARVLFPLAWAGLLTLDRRRATVLLPLLGVPLLTCVVIFVTSRYRLPLVLPACVLAGGALAALTARATAARRRALLAVTAAAALLLPLLLPPPLAPVLATDARVAGEQLFRQGDHAAALAWFRVSAGHGLQAGTAARLGDLAVIAGDTAGAAQWYDTAVAGFARDGDMRLRDAYRARRAALAR